MRLRRLLCLLRSMLFAVHARRFFAMVTAAHASEALASLAALSASLSGSTPSFAMAVAAHAAVTGALLAALMPRLADARHPLRRWRQPTRQ